MPSETSAPLRPVWVWVGAIASGLIVTLLAGSAPFGLLFALNARHHPEIPWLAIGELVFVGLLLAWLGGVGPPRSTAHWRAFHLRLRRPGGRWDGEVVAIVAAILALNVVYLLASTATGRSQGIDPATYPTTAIRFSAFIMGALLSGVGEEAGFRGYMQSQLERFGPGVAIAASSAVFALAHITHGWSVLPLMPGYFLVSVLYGLLALRTGSILPSMALHVLGDMAAAWFIVLGGHGELLFAG